MYTPTGAHTSSHWKSSVTGGGPSGNWETRRAGCPVPLSWTSESWRCNARSATFWAARSHCAPSFDKTGRLKAKAPGTELRHEPLHADGKPASNGELWGVNSGGSKLKVVLLFHNLPWDAQVVGHLVVRFKPRIAGHGLGASKWPSSPL